MSSLKNQGVVMAIRYSAAETWTRRRSCLDIPTITLMVADPTAMQIMATKITITRLPRRVRYPHEIMTTPFRFRRWRRLRFTRLRRKTRGSRTADALAVQFLFQGQTDEQVVAFAGDEEARLGQWLQAQGRMASKSSATV